MIETESRTLNGDQLKGQFIVAMPQLGDPNFEHTVVLMCEHTSDGAMGLVVNRPLPFSLEQVYEGQGIEQDGYNEEPVHFGGPVQPEAGFLLYQGSSTYAGSTHVAKGIHLGTSVEILQDIAARVGPERFIFVLGYAGWGPEQLEGELARNDWLVVPCDPETIFRLPAGERWDHAIRSLGIDPNLLSQTSGSA